MVKPVIDFRFFALVGSILGLAVAIGLSLYRKEEPVLWLLVGYYSCLSVAAYFYWKPIWHWLDYVERKFIGHM